MLGAPENQVHASLTRLADEFGPAPSASPNLINASLSTVIDDIVEPRTPAEACLAPTLALLGWAGEGRRIHEALPHFERIGDIEGLRSVLSRLGYDTAQRATKLSEIAPAMMPCLFSGDGTDATLIAERNPDGSLLAFIGERASWEHLEPGNRKG